MAAGETETAHEGSMVKAIAASTRVLHSRLNRLIMARLQLALPPRTADPSLYTSGLFHIAPIYMTFEGLWEAVLASPPTTPRPDDLTGGDGSLGLGTGTGDLPDDGPRLSSELYSALQSLRLPGLMRSAKLKEDLAALTGLSEHVVQDQLELMGATGRLGDFLHHLRRSVEQRPHVLIAYAYIFFMALFAGGRYIRASLESVGHGFWNQCPSPIRPNMLVCEKLRRDSDESLDAAEACRDEPSRASRGSAESHGFPLRFFHFTTPVDGDDLKQEFKKRLSAVELILTAQEKDDIVKESISIFENMSLLVHQLDEVCLGGQGAADADDMMSRLRDSVSVTRERKYARSNTTRSDDSFCSVVRPHAKLGLAKSASEDAPAMEQDYYSIPHHPRISGSSSHALCPGLSKSMRFDQELSKPERSNFSHEERAEYPRSSMLPSYGRHVATCILLVTFGIMFAGALVTGQKGLRDW